MNETKTQRPVQTLAMAAMLMAVGFVLPFFTGQIPQIGKMLCPLHLPVLLCGFLCGWKYGLAVGFAAPLLRFLLFGMPPIMPTGLAMMFELAAYGAFSGLLLQFLPKKLYCLYASLIGAMLGGRIVWGIARFVLGQIVGPAFTFPLFLSGAFVSAVPGIVCHILLIPPVVIGVRRAMSR